MTETAEHVLWVSLGLNQRRLDLVEADFRNLAARAQSGIGQAERL
jgi:hypothetical protein